MLYYVKLPTEILSAKRQSRKAKKSC